jgi:glyoxylase-like metal-dependent hydrolase (beta-lactamase superfamily II)
VALPICVTCGVQYGAPATECAVCEDARQWVPEGGQEWTTLEDLRAGEHHNVFRAEGDLTGIGTSPRFAIGQRALLVPHGSRNVLWDCISLLDEPTVAEIADRGGLHAIAISHPHYYATLVEWARELDCPVLLHEADREWVMRPDDAIEFWSGETYDLGDGLTLIRCGGHFAGGTVLHRPGELLSGDIVQVIPDRGWVSFHVQLSEPDPAAGVLGARDRRCARALRLRAHLRRVVGHGHRRLRKRDRAAFRAALHRRPARETAMKMRSRG